MTHSDPNPNPLAERKAISVAVKRIESDTLYTAQTNFVQATFFRRLHFWIGVPAVCFAAIASAAVITDWSSAVAGVCALVAAVLTAVQTFVNPERQAVEHNAQGAEYRDLQKDAHRFRTVGMLSMSMEMQRQKFDELCRRQTDLNRLNRPSERAFKKAQEKVKAGDPLHPGDEQLV
ncbi:MAG: SLATT domain-containing protein [Solirubrobacteraceae bacterium]